MIIVYRPEGGEEQRFDTRMLRTSEAQIVERTVDMRWAQVKAGLREDDPAAMRGVVWVLMKRQTPSLRFSEFDPGVEELSARFDLREVAEYTDEALKAPISETERAEALRELERFADDPAAAAVVIKERTEGPKEAGAVEEAPAPPPVAIPMPEASPSSV